LAGLQPQLAEVAAPKTPTFGADKDVPIGRTIGEPVKVRAKVGQHNSGDRDRSLAGRGLGIPDVERPIAGFSLSSCDSDETAGEVNITSAESASSPKRKLAKVASSTSAR
jgi:hypothetical protein